jgi:hypothetical protein
MSEGGIVIIVVALAACCCSLSSSSVAGAIIFRGRIFGGGGGDKQKLIAYYTDVMERTTNEKLKGKIPGIIEVINNTPPGINEGAHYANLWKQAQADKDKLYRMAGLA